MSSSQAGIVGESLTDTHDPAGTDMCRSCIAEERRAPCRRTLRSTRSLPAGLRGLRRRMQATVKPRHSSSDLGRHSASATVARAARRTGVALATPAAWAESGSGTTRYRSTLPTWRRAACRTLRLLVGAGSRFPLRQVSTNRGGQRRAVVVAAEGAEGAAGARRAEETLRKRMERSRRRT